MRPCGPPRRTGENKGGLACRRAPSCCKNKFLSTGSDTSNICWFGLLGLLGLSDNRS